MALALIGALTGMGGFLVCLHIVGEAESRVAGNSQFDTPDSVRTFPIEVKSRTVFVEPAYGRKYQLATSLVLTTWLVGAASIIILKLSSRAASRPDE